LPSLTIRCEQPADHAAIRELITAAFQRADEAVLVDHLRSNGECIIALVAVDRGEIVGHVLFSKMAAPFRALGLGPVSVKRDRQRLGIGSELIREGLNRAKQAGWQGVFVVGDSKYYTRFGFDPAAASSFKSRWSGPHLMALPLGVELPVSQGTVEYATAYDSVNPTPVGS
jgi:putative acetyltransferase